MQDWVTGKGKGRRATHKALCCWQWGLWALSRDPPRERSAAGPQLSPDGREQKGQQPRRGGLRAAGFVGIWRPRGTAPPRRVDKGLPPGLRGGRGTQPARSPASSGKWLRYPRGIATGRCYCPRRAAGGAARLPAPPRPLAAAVHTRRGAEPSARGPHTRAATGHAPTRPAPRRQPITRCETSARAGPASGLFHWRNRASLTACPAPPLTSAVGGGSGLLPTPLRGPNRQRRRGWPGPRRFSARSAVPGLLPHHRRAATALLGRAGGCGRAGGGSAHARGAARLCEEGCACAKAAGRERVGRLCQCASATAPRTVGLGRPLVAAASPLLAVLSPFAHRFSCAPRCGSGLAGCVPAAYGAVPAEVR